MSPQELDLIASLQNWAPEQAQTNSAGVGEILGRNIVNLPGRAVSSLVEGIQGLAYAGAPDKAPSSFRVPDFLQAPEVAEDASMGAKLAEVLTGSVAPEIAALLVPYLGISKVSKAAGAGRVLSTTLANFGQGVVGGSKYSPEEAARFGLTGAALTPISAIPGVGKRIALAAPIAALDYEAMRSSGMTQGMAATGAAVDLVAGVIPIGKLRTAHTQVPELQAEETAKVAAREARTLETGSVQEKMAAMVKKKQEQEEMSNFISGYSQPSIKSPMTPIAPPKLTPTNLSPLAPPMMPAPKPNLPQLIVPENTPAQVQFEGFAPVSAQAMAKYEADQRAMEALAATVGLQKAKGKIPELPEFMRTQGGFVGDNEILKTVLASGASGFAGGAIGGIATGTEGGMFGGMALGLAAPWGLKALAKNSTNVLDDIVPAIRIQGKTVRGFPKETHRQILDRYIAEHPDDAADALFDFDTKANPNFFLKGSNPIPISREHLKESFGISDAQGLARLQTERASPPKGEAGSIPADRKPAQPKPTKIELDKRPDTIELKSGMKLVKMADDDPYDVVYEYQDATGKSGGILTLTKHPSTGIWHVNQHNLADALRGKGIGEQTIKELGESLGEIRSWDIDEQSPAATKMWERMGATKVDDSGGVANVYSWKPSQIASLQKPAESIHKPSAVVKNSQKPDLVVAKTIVQTETPEFKQWFEKSQVVDETGKPLVVYHGTGADPFDTFNTRKAERYGWGQGSHFTDDPKIASTYAGQWEGRASDKQRVYPAFLSIKNPAPEKLYWEMESELYNSGMTNTIVKNIEIRKRLQAMGYDGVAYTQQGSRHFTAFEPNQIKSATGNSGAFSLKSNAITGDIARELLLPLVGGIAGAGAGYAEAGVEGAAALGISGVVGGVLLGRGIDALERLAPKLTTPGKGSAATAKTLSQKSFEGVKKALNKPGKDLAGEDVDGRGGIIPKVFRILENQFKLHVPDAFNTAVTRARGFPSEIVDRVNVALREAIRHSPPAEVKTLTNNFLDGRLVTAKEELTFLQANGGIDEAAFAKLSKVQKGNYSVWTVKDVDQQGKQTVTKWYVNTDIRDSFLSLQESAFLKQIPEDWRLFANLQITARRGMNDFQKIIADALPEGPLKEKIEDSLGRYVPRQYRIFTDPKYKATDAQVQSAMKEFGVSEAQKELDNAIGVGKANTEAEYRRKFAMYDRQKDPQSQGRLVSLTKFQPVQVNGVRYYAAPEIAETLRKYGNEDFLRKEIEFYLDQKAGHRQLIGGGRGIDKTLFIEREDIGPAFRDLLGEYTDPVERMAMGVNKIYAPAQAAKLVSMAREMEIDGLPIAMSGDTWSAMNTSLREAIGGLSDQTQIASLQKQLDVLNSYKKLADDIRYGEYSGLYTSRFVADYFADDNRMWETSIGRHMAQFNRLFKVFHIPLNPVSQLRQIISMPVFAAIGRATPAAFGQATKAYKNVDSKLRAELLREGIWTADFIRGELQETASTILNGRYDSAIVRGVKKGVETALEAYRVPDMLVRGATYIAAKNRLALKLGKAIDSPEIIQAAVQWTDRYTMNYDNISKFVKIARNVPFVNPFISFQAEMLRILKNFVIDSAKGDMERLATLGGLVAMPYMLSMAGESSLKEEDRELWKRTKAMLPPYMREQSLIPIAKLQNGKFKYVAVSPVIPQDNFQQAVQAMAKGDMEALAAINPFISRNSSPLFNMISELVTGEDKQTGLKFRSNKEALSNVISDFLPPLAPGGYEWKRLANVNVENLRSGKVEDWGDIALRYTTGLSSGVIKPDSVVASAKGKLKRDVADLRAHFTRISRTTAPDADKHQAYEEYREGVQLLIQDFAERYGGSLSPSAQGK